MIASIIIRNFKIYKNITYIPLSNGTNFNGLIGANGIGKSSILEALDCFFNGKPWIKNIETKSLSDSWVMPVFIFKEGEIEWGETESFVRLYTTYVKEILRRDLSIDAIAKNVVKVTNELRKHLYEYFSESDIILPICLAGDHNVVQGIFNTTDFKNYIKRFDGFDIEDLEPNLERVYNIIKEQLTYVYIPKDIEAERIIRFENEDIQHLFDSNLYNEVANILTRSDINKISTNLKKYVEEISSSLDGYHFKVRSSKQPNLKPVKIYSLIIEEFFSLRELFKTSKDGKEIPLAQLSSGEKQQALIALVYYIVTKYRDRNSNLIVAVDEPEASLHVALCYEQFEKLHEVSAFCKQVLFASHWYGFIPTLVDGCFNHISQNGMTHSCFLFNIEYYREEIKHKDAETKGQLPIDIMLKSTNDLTQSIISSIIKEDAYNWIVCEGSSDMIYMKAYMDEEIKNNRLRIIPVCKASEIKKIYAQLCAVLEDLKRDVIGKVFLLTDTDTNSVAYKTLTAFDKIVRWRRIVNDETTKQTLLVQVDPETNPKAPNTDIEDALNGRIFGFVVNQLRTDFPILDVINEDEKNESPSFYALDLRPSEYAKLDEFFNGNRGANKVLFAKKYAEILSLGEYQVPSWISEIKSFIRG